MHVWFELLIEMTPFLYPRRQTLLKIRDLTLTLFFWFLLTKLFMLLTENVQEIKVLSVKYKSELPNCTDECFEEFDISANKISLQKVLRTSQVLRILYIL